MKTATAVLLGLATATATTCDIYDAAGTPCVAAHSLTRSLYASYSGRLYQIKRSSDKATLNINTTPGGVADTSAQDFFCAQTTCTVEIIYDQSSRQNHLTTAPPGGAHNKSDAGVAASKAKTTMHRQPVYGAYFEGGMGYRIDNSNGVAVGDEAESMYMVAGGRHYNGGCCFDYGNAETNNLDTGAGSMEAIYFGNSSGWGRAKGKGPWIMADLENGLWAGRERVGPGPSIDAEYVTAMLKGDSGDHFALKGGDATEGHLTLLYDGPRPNGYHPMKKQGSIILGIGGDNSDSAVGTFYEGVMTQGFSSDATDAAVQANIIGAGYGQ
jgi:non-reducing end alpha-L-arabinofuranosidase